MKLSCLVLALVTILILAAVFAGGIMVSHWIPRPYALLHTYPSYGMRLYNHVMKDYYRSGMMGRHDRGFSVMESNKTLERRGYGMLNGRRIIGRFNGGTMGSRGRGFGKMGDWKKHQIPSPSSQNKPLPQQRTF